MVVRLLIVVSKLILLCNSTMNIIDVKSQSKILIQTLFVDINTINDSKSTLSIKSLLENSQKLN